MRRHVREGKLNILLPAAPAAAPLKLLKVFSTCEPILHEFRHDKISLQVYFEVFDL